MYIFRKENCKISWFEIKEDLAFYTFVIEADIFLLQQIRNHLQLIVFTGCKIGGVTIEQVFKRLMPFFIVSAIILLFVTFLPALSMTLPQMLDLVK